MKRIVLVLRILVAAVVLVIAVRVLQHEFRELSAADVWRSLGAIGAGGVMLSLAATLVGFAAMAPYDALALRYAGKALSLPRSALSSTSVYAVSNLLGFPVLTGNAVRYWLFARWGLGLGDVAIAAVVTTVVCNIVLALIIGVSLVAAPDLLQPFALPAQLGRGIGAALVLAAGGLTLAAVFGPKRIRAWKLDIARPGPILAPHMLACTLDYLAAAAVLWFPLSGVIEIDFLPFLALFALAKLVGVMSNVPGGLGVFEALMVTLTPAGSEATFAAALIVYRLVYYLLPFGIAAAFLAVHGLARTRRRASPRATQSPD